MLHSAVKLERGLINILGRTIITRVGINSVTNRIDACRYAIYTELQ